jgi:hypothetical protein
LKKKELKKKYPLAAPSMVSKEAPKNRQPHRAISACTGISGFEEENGITEALIVPRCDLHVRTAMQGAGTSGAVIDFATRSREADVGCGSWAVTAP